MFDDNVTAHSCLSSSGRLTLAILTDSFGGGLFKLYLLPIGRHYFNHLIRRVRNGMFPKLADGVVAPKQTSNVFFVTLCRVCRICRIRRIVGSISGHSPQFCKSTSLLWTTIRNSLIRSTLR